MSWKLEFQQPISKLSRTNATFLARLKSDLFYAGDWSMHQIHSFVSKEIKDKEESISDRRQYFNLKSELKGEEVSIIYYPPSTDPVLVAMIKKEVPS